MTFIQILDVHKSKNVFNLLLNEGTRHTNMVLEVQRRSQGNTNLYGVKECEKNEHKTVIFRGRGRLVLLEDGRFFVCLFLHIWKQFTELQNCVVKDTCP